MASAMNLPAGFELDNEPAQPKLPPGFELDGESGSTGAPLSGMDQAKALISQGMQATPLGGMFNAVKKTSELLSKPVLQLPPAAQKAASYVTALTTRPGRALGVGAAEGLEPQQLIGLPAMGVPNAPKLFRDVKAAYQPGYQPKTTAQAIGANIGEGAALAGLGLTGSFAPAAAMAANDVEKNGALSPMDVLAVGGSVASGASHLLKPTLEEIGARGINNATGINPETIGKLAGKNNPVGVGTRLGKSLVDEGAFGNTPGATFDNASAVMSRYGQDVDSALEAIRKSGQPTSVDASAALQPLISKIEDVQTSTFSADRATARPLMEVYTKLARTAKANGGQLGLDQIREEMQQTGDAIGRLGKNNPNLQTFKDIYHILADTRDAMTQQIAKAAGNPSLASDLIKANEGYSRYSRIMPDIAKAARKSAVGQSSIPLERRGLFSRAADALQPSVSRLLLNAGRPEIGRGVSHLATDAPSGDQPQQSAPPGIYALPLFQDRKPPPLFRKAS